MRVGELCTRNPVCFTRDARLLEAAREMRHSHVGAVVVVEQRGEVRVPVGVVTDRDVVVGVLAGDPQSLELLEVGSVMGEAALVTALEDEDVAPVLSRMRWATVRRVLVVDAAGGLVGMLTLDDILPALSRQLADIAMLLTQQPAHEHEDRP